MYTPLMECGKIMAILSIKKLEYFMVFVRMFVEHFGLNEKQAFNYLDRHKGLAFVRDYYEVMHTLDFDYAIQDVQEVCQTNGGRL